jgi:UDP-GlcNAc:undecaprenyl-phosphate/decaprenyl-phosphate GlcNAc-1-phosphate transferase
MQPTFAFIIVLVLSFSVSVIVTPLSIWIGRHFNLVDRPGGRRAHQNLIPRIGGIGIFAGFLIASMVAQFLPVPRFDPNEITRFTGLIVGGTFIFVMGLWDDVREFGPIPQFIAQGVAASIAIAFLIFIERINNPFTGQPIEWGHLITISVTVVWLGLMMNTVNFLDGLDGLASGVSLIAGLMLFVNSAFRIVPAQTSVSLLPLALVGSCLGFLMYNFNPARVFMGSSGAYFLGYALGTLSIIGGAKMATILLVMGLPLLDVIWQIVNRMSQGRNPFHGDRGHLHFRLVDMGYSQRLIVLSYYLFCTFFGVLTLVITSQLYKMLALVLMTVFVVVGFYLLKRMDYQASSSSSTGSSPSAS